MQAIILAGGLGTRLRPLTSELPKPMIWVGNKPLMEYSIDLLKKHGINDIGVTVMFLPQYIKEYFGNGEKFGVKIKYYDEKIPVGTAGSIKQAENDLDDTFLILSGDALTNIDLTKILLYHKSINADVTIVLRKETNPLEFGVVETDTDGKITGFSEKPQWENVKSNTVNTGIYIINKSILEYIPQNTDFDFANDLFPELLKENKNMYGYITEEYWCDLGKAETYLSANYDLINGKIFGKKYDVVSGEGLTVSEETVFLPPVYIGKKVKIQGSNVIGPNVIIGDNCEISNCKITDSVLWRDSSFSNTDFSSCIVGANSEIDSSVLAGNNVIGSFVTVKKNAHIKNGVKVFNNITVLSETTVSEDMINSDFRTKNLWNNGAIYGVFGKDINEKILKGMAFSYNFEKIAIVSVKNTANIANLLASFYSLSGAKTYIFCAMESSARYFACINKIPSIYIDSFNGKLRIQFFDENGLNISSLAEKKINFNSENDYKCGKIIRLSDRDAEFEYFLNSSFPMIDTNVCLKTKDKYKVHNVYYSDDIFSGGIFIHAENGIINEIINEKTKISAFDFMKLKINLIEILGGKEVFLPPYADKEIISFAESKGIKVLNCMQHKGNMMQQVDSFLNVASLLEFEPTFFSLAYSCYRNVYSQKNSDSKICVYNFNCMPEETSKIIHILNSENKKYNNIFTIVPKNDGYSFSVYKKFYEEEYAPDLIENFVNDSIKNLTK